MWGKDIAGLADAAQAPQYDLYRKPQMARRKHETNLQSMVLVFSEGSTVAEMMTSTKHHFDSTLPKSLHPSSPPIITKSP